MTAPAKAGMKSDPPKAIIEPIKEEYKVKPTMAEEQEKYIKCWELDDYRKYSPGEGLVDMFLELGVEKGTLIDWGCGTGRAALKLHKAGFDVTAVDFAANCLDDAVREEIGDRFIEHDLTKETDLTSEYGFCTDVLEHIPTDDVPTVLKNIITASKQCFFQISTTDDIFSKHPHLHVDSELHLTVKDYNWWLNQFGKLRCIIHRSRETGNSVIFFVTGWSERTISWDAGVLNTDIEVIKDNIEANAKLDIQPIRPHSGDGEVEVMLLCGGPSLNDFEDDIKQKRENGVKCITVNGTYNWCLERGIKPSMQCMVDAREFMHRFVEQAEGITDETKYAISSQCDPAIFDIVPHDRTYMWQTSISKEMIPHITEHFGKPHEDWWPSPGGSTVGLRALLLLRVLGFNLIHVYGMDSCINGETHHAYPQQENDYLDEKDTIGVTVGKGTELEKTFQCQLWHAFQAAEFQKLIPNIPDDVKLKVYGDGLIAYFLEAAAQYDVSLEVEGAAMPPE